MNPLQFVLVSLAGWVNRDQQGVIEYLRAENRVLREMLPKKRLSFTQSCGCPASYLLRTFLTS